MTDYTNTLAEAESWLFDVLFSEEKALAIKNLIKCMIAEAKESEPDPTDTPGPALTRIAEALYGHGAKFNASPTAIANDAVERLEVAASNTGPSPLVSALCAISDELQAQGHDHGVHSADIAKAAVTALRAAVPQRITEETPDGVLAWNGEEYGPVHRGVTGNWMCSSTFYLDPQPTHYLPMPPVPRGEG